MKYLLITSDTEPNIAVLKCKDNGEFDNEVLANALSEHFDEDINVNSVEVLSLHPIKLIAKCYTTTELDMFNVDLNQTWVY
jgi:hypothetical protein